MDGTAGHPSQHAPARAVSLSGWGRRGAHATRLASPESPEAAAALLAGHVAGGEGPAIARGAGRAYGDSAVAPGGLTLSTARLAAIQPPDPETGLIEAGAGARIADIATAALAAGRFPVVLPGTGHATLGGCIAADVHGKNHHRDGGFCDHLARLDLLGSDGAVRRVAPGDPLFAATAGGMGLTGLILSAAFATRPVETGWIVAGSRPLGDLGEAMAAMAEDPGPYAVAWIDARARGARLGRGVLETGRHAARADLAPGADPRSPARRARLSVPLTPPAGLVGRPAVALLNALWRAKGRRAAAAGPRPVPWRAFFHPLDALGGWPRLYGPRGFVQIQCVLPEGTAEAGLARLLEAAADPAAPVPVALAVLKRMGRAGAGTLSFPRAGWTLALDLPGARGAAAEAHLDRLERLAADHGGRFYLAKDARLGRDRFAATEPRAAGFRDAATRDRAFASAQSMRLGL